MARYTVAPSGNGWVVKEYGTVKSRHRKKSAAKRKASRIASSGDTVRVKRSNGTIQDTRRVR